MSYKQRLNELEIPFWNFYKAKRKYRLEDEASVGTGEFVQMVPGSFSPGLMPIRNGKKPSTSKGGQEAESYLTVELRTASGTAMRIQGCMTAAHLREIISAG